MCGILGILTTNEPPAERGMERGLAVMAHRGPDGQGVWRRAVAGPPWVAFGHRRLAIIDLSAAAAQPMPSEDGMLCLTYNGEIYNYRELMGDLVAAGYTFRSQSDTEVLLKAYRYWGADCLERLNGMFAFAIWDEARREVFAARDRFGEKPFHYVWNERRQVFAFASEIKGLLAAGAAEYAVDEAALRRFVERGVMADDEATIIRGVRRLPPASALRLDCRGPAMSLSQWTYWTVGDGVRYDLGDTEASEQFRELFEDSVRLRLRSDVPVGTSLSGGIDSSAVVCTIRQLGAAGGQKAFSARMEEAALDEGRYISEVLDRTGIEGHEVIPTADALRREFSRLCFHMEEPFPATSMFAQYLVMRLAGEHRVTVLLDGQGADEMLAGYHGYFRDYYGDLLRAGRLPSVLRELRCHARLRNGAAAMTARGLASSLLPEQWSARLSGRGRGAKQFGDWWERDWLLAARGAVDGRASIPYFGRLRAKLLHDSFAGPLQELLRYGDRNSMAWSRELRQPFLDHRLAEFVFSLPPEQKICHGTTKIVLRRAMRGLVPDAILDRHDKLGYQAPQGQWLSDSLRCWCEEGLEKTAALLGGMIAPGVVERYRSLRHPLAEWSDARDVFRLLTLGECLDQLRQVAAGADRPTQPEAPDFTSGERHLPPTP